MHASAPPAWAEYADIVLAFWPLVADHFRANAAVSALVDARLAADRNSAVTICAMMLQDGVFLRVGAPVAPFADDDARYRRTWHSAIESRDYVLLQRAPAAPPPAASLNPMRDESPPDFDDAISEASDTRAPVPTESQPWPHAPNAAQPVDPFAPRAAADPFAAPRANVDPFAASAADPFAAMDATTDAMFVDVTDAKAVSLFDADVDGLEFIDEHVNSRPSGRDQRITPPGLREEVERFTRIAANPPPEAPSVEGRQTLTARPACGEETRGVRPGRSNAPLYAHRTQAGSKKFLRSSFDVPRQEIRRARGASIDFPRPRLYAMPINADRVRGASIDMPYSRYPARVQSADVMQRTLHVPPPRGISADILHSTSPVRGTSIDVGGPEDEAHEVAGEYIEISQQEYIPRAPSMESSRPMRLAPDRSIDERHRVRAASIDVPGSFRQARQKTLAPPSVKRRAALLKTDSAAWRRIGHCNRSSLNGSLNRIHNATPEPLPNVVALREKLSRAFCPEPQISVSRVTTAGTNDEAAACRPDDEHMRGMRERMPDSVEVEQLCASPITAPLGHPLTNVSREPHRRSRTASRRRLLSMLGPRVGRVRRALSRSPSYVNAPEDAQDYNYAGPAPSIDLPHADRAAASVRVSSTFTESETGSNTRLHSAKFRAATSFRDRLVNSIRRGRRPFGGRDAFEDRDDDAELPPPEAAWREMRGRS